jgi:hypothetical protein
VSGPAGERCEWCTAYEPWDEEVGECRARPPEVGARNLVRDCWPRVSAGEWCREFEDRREA